MKKHYLYVSLILLCLSATARAAQPLNIAIDADFSSVAVEGGNAIYQGVQLAVDEINAQGGVMGRPLAIKKMDHRGIPVRGITNIKRLAKQKNLLAVVGGIHTPVALAELPAIHENNLLYLGAWAAGTGVVSNDYSPNNVFRVSIRDSEAGQVLIQHAKSRGFTDVALALERTGWGRSNLESLTRAAEKAGITITKTTWINWQQQTFSEDMKAIVESNAQAIILVTNAPEGAVIVNALNDSQGNKLPVIAHWGIAGGDFAQRVGTRLLEQMDIAVIQTFSFLHQKNPIAAKLLEKYSAKFGNTDAAAIPAVVGVAHAYDLVHMLARAARQAGATDTDSLRTALESLPAFDGAVKQYNPAFTEKRHDALWADDYFMASYNKDGNLIPITR